MIFLKGWSNFEGKLLSFIIISSFRELSLQAYYDSGWQDQAIWVMVSQHDLWFWVKLTARRQSSDRIVRCWMPGPVTRIIWFTSIPWPKQLAFQFDWTRNCARNQRKPTENGIPIEAHRRMKTQNQIQRLRVWRKNRTSCRTKIHTWMRKHINICTHMQWTGFRDASHKTPMNTVRTSGRMRFEVLKLRPED